MSLATLSPVAPMAAPPPDVGGGLSEGDLVALVLDLASAGGPWATARPIEGVERSSVHLVATPAYDVWLLAWPTGTRVEPHDHGDSAGAFLVLRGSLTELRWSPEPVRRPVRAGEVVTVARGVVHDVLAGTGDEGPALSLHAYSPPLRTMGFFGDDGSELIGRVAVDPEPAALRAGSSAQQPDDSRRRDT